jgi:hypothetical protein
MILVKINLILPNQAIHPKQTQVSSSPSKAATAAVINRKFRSNLSPNSLSHNNSSRLSHPNHLNPNNPHSPNNPHNLNNRLSPSSQHNQHNQNQWSQSRKNKKRPRSASG